MLANFAYIGYIYTNVAPRADVAQCCAYMHTFEPLGICYKVL